jgi:hypothetical protein
VMFWNRNQCIENTFFGAEVKVWNPIRKIWRFLLKSIEIPRYLR